AYDVGREVRRRRWLRVKRSAIGDGLMASGVRQSVAAFGSALGATPVPHRIGDCRLMPETAPLLALEQVSMDFGNQRVLRDVSWHVNRGETVVVIGESGCGKTCVLKLLIGLLSPTRGRIRFDGRSWIDLLERETVKQRLRFGFLFQGAALFDSLTVFE